MTYFKDTENKLHFLNDASFIHLLPEGSVEITDEEVDELRKPHPETPEQNIARLEAVIDNYLDNQAKEFRYESIRTMVTYENDPNPKFHAEGLGAKQFRSAIYTLGVSLIDEVQSGLREVPTEEELLALMPKLDDFVSY